MTTQIHTRTLRCLIAAALAASSFTVQAHGDEPHGDEPHPAVAAPATGNRFEAATDAFEVVGRLDSHALTLYISRFATSEPVAQAAVELEWGELQAVAAYRADQGSYVVSDQKMVESLGRPGQHPLVITVTAGDEADLLDATLSNPLLAGVATTDPSRLPLVLGGAGLLAAVGGGAAVARQRRHNSPRELT